MLGSHPVCKSFSSSLRPKVVVSSALSSSESISNLLSVVCSSCSNAGSINTLNPNISSLGVLNIAGHFSGSLLSDQDMGFNSLFFVGVDPKMDLSPEQQVFLKQ